MVIVIKVEKRKFKKRISPGTSESGHFRGAWHISGAVGDDALIDPEFLEAYACYEALSFIEDILGGNLLNIVNEINITSRKFRIASENPSSHAPG